MTAAERKVKERYPDAVVRSADLWGVWAKTAPHTPTCLGFALSADDAWANAASRLVPAPPEGAPTYADLVKSAKEMAAAVASYFPFYAAECLNSGRPRSHEELSEIAERARALLSRLPKVEP